MDKNQQQPRNTMQYMQGFELSPTMWPSDAFESPIDRAANYATKNKPWPYAFHSSRQVSSSSLFNIAHATVFI
jgi:hypothetical protein